MIVLVRMCTIVQKNGREQGSFWDMEILDNHFVPNLLIWMFSLKTFAKNRKVHRNLLWFTIWDRYVTQVEQGRNNKVRQGKYEKKKSAYLPCLKKLMLMFSVCWTYQTSSSSSSSPCSSSVPIIAVFSFSLSFSSCSWSSPSWFSSVPSAFSCETSSSFTSPSFFLSLTSFWSWSLSFPISSSSFGS